MATKTDFSMFTDENDRAAKAAKLGKRGKLHKADVEKFLTASANWFTQMETPNIQVINDAVNVCYDSGMNGGHVIDWFVNIIPHEVRKQKENKRRYEFGKKDKSRAIESDMVVKFLKENPTPFEWGKMGNTTPEAFDLGTATQKFLDRISKEGYDFSDVVSLYNESIKEEAA